MVNSKFSGKKSLKILAIHTYKYTPKEVFVYICMPTYTHLHLFIRIYTKMCVCMCVCVCVCVYNQDTHTLPKRCRCVYGFATHTCERRDRQDGRGGGVACYVRSDVAYQRLTELENGNQEVLWLKLSPKRLPRKYSCILAGVVYHPPGADNCDLRECLITRIDSTLRSYLECGALILGDLNQLHDSFLSTHYGYRQVVNKPTRMGAILDKIWTNLAPVYDNPIVLSELGTSDHCMVLFSPSMYMYPALDPGAVQRITTRCTGRNKVAFASALAQIRWEPLYHTASCRGQFEYFQSSMDSLLERCFHTKQ